MRKDHATSEDPTPKDLGNRLKAAREIHGLDQAEVKEKMKVVGLPYSQLSDLEQGKAPFPPTYRNGMAELLGVDRSWFYAPLTELVGERPKPSLDARLQAIEEHLAALPQQLAKAVDRIVQEPRQEDPANDEESDSTQSDEEDEQPPAQEQP